MELTKIILEYEDEEGTSLESVWATPVEGNYRVENIPFYATSIAYRDVVSARVENGELLFDSLIEASGHSVVQLMIFNERDVDRVTQELVNLSCTWEGSYLPNYIAIDIPVGIDYRLVKRYLEEKTADEVLAYKEACLGFL